MHAIHLFAILIILHTKCDILSSLADDTLFNAALYKPAFQSSVFQGNSAERGNDGRMRGEMNSGNCMHTLCQNNSWWMVDLMDDYVIHGIFLTNRGDWYATAIKLNNFQIDVFKTDPRLAPPFPLDSGDICYNQTAPVGTGNYTWNCARPTVGRYLRLIKSNDECLHMCEMQVMASILKSRVRNFKLYQNKKLNMTSLLNLTVSKPLLCGSQCLQKHFTGGCTAFNWFPATRLCLLFYLDPRITSLVSQLVSVSGAQFYIMTY
ncbi:fucolectin-like [Physella acuta]|uniref:fucolectin-like n=1 Tax=Physella acuta TaxID=109671 RepID=UPI0027DCBF29|nr:fucolectin-like [Physella acuta]